METAEEKDAGNVGNVEVVTEGDEKKPAPKEDPAIAELRAENVRLREQTEKASRDAAASQAYVHEVVSRLQAAANARIAESQQPPGETRDIRELLQEDPVSVLDQHFQTRMAPLINQSLEYQVQSAKELFEQRMSANEEFQEYKDELDEFMRGIPPAVKAQPKAWIDGLNFIRARHIDEIVEKRRKKQVETDRRAFVEPASAGGARRPSEATLNDDQKAIAKGLGIPEEEYVKWLTA